MSSSESIILGSVGGLYVIQLFVWILMIEPYVRRRTRTSAFFLLPWAPWKDYKAGLRLVHRYPTRPWFFTFFRGLTLLEIIGIVAWIALWVRG